MKVLCIARNNRLLDTQFVISVEAAEQNRGRGGLFVPRSYETGQLFVGFHSLKDEASPRYIDVEYHHFFCWTSLSLNIMSSEIWLLSLLRPAWLVGTIVKQNQKIIHPKRATAVTRSKYILTPRTCPQHPGHSPLSDSSALLTNPCFRAAHPRTLSINNQSSFLPLYPSCIHSFLLFSVHSTARLVSPPPPSPAVRCPTFTWRACFILRVENAKPLAQPLILATKNDSHARLCTRVCVGHMQQI